MAKLALTLLISIGLCAPMLAQNKKTAVNTAFKIPLATVLGCESDPLVQSIFRLTVEDATRVNMKVDDKLTPTYNSSTADMYGFYTHYHQSNKSFSVISKKPPDIYFCHNFLSFSAFVDGHPLMVELDAADTFSLDPNEVFRHADQFKFESGVFNDSTDVYLIATKDNVSIQFVFEDGSLKLYRITYSNPNVKSN